MEYKVRIETENRTEICEASREFCFRLFEINEINVLLIEICYSMDQNKIQIYKQR